MKHRRGVTREQTLAMVKKDGLALKDAPLAFRKDPGIVLAAVKQNGDAFQYAHSSAIINAITRYGDQSQLLGAIKKKLSILRHADKKTMLFLIERDPTMLQYASYELKADKEVVLKAVASNGVMEQCCNMHPMN